MIFVEHINLFGKLCGKGHCLLDHWGKKPNFNSLYLKKKFSELLRSSKPCPGCFACSSSFNQKENLRVRCYQHSHFIDEDTEAQRL